MASWGKKKHWACFGLFVIVYPSLFIIIYHSETPSAPQNKMEPEQKSRFLARYTENYIFSWKLLLARRAEMEKQMRMWSKCLLRLSHNHLTVISGLLGRVVMPRISIIPSFFPSCLEFFLSFTFSVKTLHLHLFH